MSKAMLVTMPCVLLLLDYWPLRSASCQIASVELDIRRLVLEKIPFFALAAAASVVTFVVQKQGGAVMTVESLPLGARIENALISYCRYLGKMFWPTDLAVFYPHPGHWPLEKAMLAGVFLCGISVLLFVKRGRYPFLLMGWLWFVGTLVPVIGLVQSGGQAMADRFTYVPSLGVLILVIWGAYELTRRWRHHVIALSVAGSAAIVLCLAVTRQQLGYWKDSEALFRHALEVTENNYIAHKNLGDALFDKGQIGRGDQPISGSHPPQTELRRSPQQPRHRPRQETSNRRGDQPISGSHPPQTRLRQRPLQPGRCARQRKAKPTRRSANFRKPSASNRITPKPTTTSASPSPRNVKLTRR